MVTTRQSGLILDRQNKSSRKTQKYIYTNRNMWGESQYDWRSPFIIVVVCSAISDNEQVRQLGAMKYQSWSDVMSSTLGNNSWEVGSIPGLGIAFPMLTLPMTLAAVTGILCDIFTVWLLNGYHLYIYVCMYTCNCKHYANIKIFTILKVKYSSMRRPLTYGSTQTGKHA